MSLAIPRSAFRTGHPFNPITSQCSTNHIKNSSWHFCGFWYKCFSRNWNIYPSLNSEAGLRSGADSVYYSYFLRAAVDTSDQGQVRNPALARTRPCFLFCPWRPWTGSGASNSYHLLAKPCTNLGTIVSLIAQDLWMGTRYCRISGKISPGAFLSHSSSLPYGDIDSDRPDRIMLSCDFLFPFFFFFSFLKGKAEKPMTRLGIFKHLAWWKGHLSGSRDVWTLVVSFPFVTCTTCLLWLSTLKHRVLTSKWWLHDKSCCKRVFKAVHFHGNGKACHRNEQFVMYRHEVYCLIT